MANIKSAKKRIRNSAKKKLRNRYQAIGTRRAIKSFLSLKDGAQAKEMLPKVVSMIDKLAKNNVIHKNKAANQKSRLAKLANKLAV